MATQTTQLEPAFVEAQVLEIVRELLVELGKHDAAQRVTLQSSFERDLGIASLDLVEMLVRCEARFEVELPDETAEQAETPAGWVRAVLQGGQEAIEKPGYRILPPSEAPPPEPRGASHLGSVLEHHCEFAPDRTHIHLLENDSGQGITYRMLFEAASGVAAGLAAAGLQRKETVAIMLPTGADFFFAFFGVTLAGGIPVPIYPPARPDRIEEYVRRQLQILHNAEIRFLISFDRVRAVSQIMRVSLPSLIDVTTVAALRRSRARIDLSAIQPSETAFLQYTSGSTGDPRGVVLRHASVLANIRGIGAAIAVRPDDVLVNWLPFSSDLGLVGSWLFALYHGIPITVLPPQDVLSRPERWLRAIHESRGTLSAAPNFGYELCTRRIPAWTLEGVDLSCWRLAVNAGEPVLPETVARFTDRFQAFGFRASSMAPCYGLAESSVAVSVSPPGRGPLLEWLDRAPFDTGGKAVPSASPGSAALGFFSVGRALPGHEIRIVDESGHPSGDRLQGRVQFRGPSSMHGYHRNPQATAAIMDAGWLDSGDLGYMAGGELFITGRRKDVILRSGSVIVPQDLEAAVGEALGVQKGSVAVFGLADPETGTERLIVVAESRATEREDLRRVRQSIAGAVEDLLGVPPDDVQLIPVGFLPKTSNGKLRRFETRTLYQKGRLRTGARPPWLQLARLWIRHCGPLVALGLWRLGSDLRRLSARVLRASVAVCCGAAQRVFPPASSLLVRRAARALLWLEGQRSSVRGRPSASSQKPEIFLANRCGLADPLLLIASLPGPPALATEEAIAGLGATLRFLFRPLVIPPLPGVSSPPGGSLRQRIRHALENGRSVLVFPDSPAGAPPHLCRFRLDAFHAAADTGAPVRPVGMRETSLARQSGGRPVFDTEITLIAGKPLPPHGAQTAADWREQARQAITDLCQ